MLEIALIVCIVLLLACVGLLALLLKRTASGGVDLTPLLSRAEAAERNHERLERSLTESLRANREEAGNAARALREEVTANLKNVGEVVTQQLIQLSRTQHERLQEFSTKLAQLTETFSQKQDALRTASDERLTRFQDGTARTLNEFSERFARQIKELADSNEKKLEAMRGTVDERLKHLQEENLKKLDQMRATVDEKLQGTLEKRLGESFKLVSERLEQVHKGLGEMQNLANGVGDLKRVLTNVSTRGTWGELRLQSILEQILAPDQYETDVSTKNDQERVEFAIRLPGRGDSDEPVWLPIDSKFPKEDYERLVAAEEACDAAAVDAARRDLERAVMTNAKMICDKYLNPPRTTDFGIMFVPTEGLYAEIVRRPAMLERLQQQYRIIVAGPTTLSALLNSLQMGFRTLAVQKRSSEVWELLGKIKTEFGKYGDVLAKVQKKLQEASNTIDQAQVRTRAIDRSLKKVEALPSAEETPLLIGEIDPPEPPDALDAPDPREASGDEDDAALASGGLA